MRKKAPSIFCNTGVADYFTKERLDTAIVAGCNISGCIRASAGDSFSHRYRIIVPEDGVGDIEAQPHHDNLRDIGRRYVDVSDLDMVLFQLEDWHRQNAPQRSPDRVGSPDRATMRATRKAPVLDQGGAPSPGQGPIIRPRRRRRRSDAPCIVMSLQMDLSLPGTAMPTKRQKNGMAANPGELDPAACQPRGR